MSVLLLAFTSTFAAAATSELTPDEDPIQEEVSEVMFIAETAPVTPTAPPAPETTMTLISSKALDSVDSCPPISSDEPAIYALVVPSKVPTATVAPTPAPPTARLPSINVAPTYERA